MVYLTFEWYKLTKHEQRIILALIEEQLRSIEIANKLGVKRGAIGASLKTFFIYPIIEIFPLRYYWNLFQYVMLIFGLYGMEMDLIIIKV